MCVHDPRNGGRRMDPCMVDRIARLNGLGVDTVACCCGHRRYPETIVVRMSSGGFKELLSGIAIPRQRRFYKRDAVGVYYIPEVVQQQATAKGGEQ